MNTMYELILNLIFGAPGWLVAITALALLQLGFWFGVTFTYCQWVKRHLTDWRQHATNPFYWLFTALAVVLLVAFLINDWLTNQVVMTVWWLVITKGQRWQPGDWRELVTGRTQRYVNLIAAGEKFNRVERGTLRFIISAATRFDPGHIGMPAGVQL